MSKGHDEARGVPLFQASSDVAFLKYADVTWVQGGYRSVAIGFLVARSIARLFPPPRGLWRPGVDLLPPARWSVAPPPKRDRRAHTSLRPKPSKGPPAFYHRS